MKKKKEKKNKKQKQNTSLTTKKPDLDRLLAPQCLGRKPKK